MEAIPSQNTFLIEIRLSRTKWRIKRTTERITSLFSITGFAEKHPHVTLFGPFLLRKDISSSMILESVEDAARHFSAVPFLINGYAMNQGLNGAVLAYRVEPTEPLVNLNAAVSSGISRLAESVNVWDTDPCRKWFHVTIANRLDRTLGTGIFRELTMQEPVPEARDPGIFRHKGDVPGGSGMDADRMGIPRPPVLDEDGIRISVINGDAIVAEYDLVRHRWFSPGSPDSAPEWQRSLQQFRKDRGIELAGPQQNAGQRPGEIFIISDLHLGHANIIRYCSRPFPHGAAGEMDAMLVRNWNCTVAPRDRVFHLGDFSYKSGRDPSWYLRHLNGTVTRIAGNHDDVPESQQKQVPVTAGGIPFILVHDPADAPPVPGTWVIHGHHHNNDLAAYPFISFEHRRINVSCEVTGYRPVSLTELTGIIREHEAVQDKKAILLRRI